MALILKNATYIDWKTFQIIKSHIRVGEGSKGTIEFVEKLPVPEESPDKIIDCKGKLVMKSFGCGHHHVYSALARGMPAPAKIPGNFHEILKYIWWNLDKCLDLDMIRASALVTALYCAKNGVTFVIDHHASPNSVEGSLFTIAEAFDEVGISHLLCYELSDRDGEMSKQKGLKETEEYLKAGHQGLVGLHASFTVGDDLLFKAVSLAEKYESGIHVHAAEGIVDQEDCLEKYNKRVIQRFSDSGALNSGKSILAHCIHVTEQETEILKSSRAFIVQNPESNLNNNVGFFHFEGHTGNLMLGTDGMHSDMLRSAKAAFLSGQRFGNISPAEVYRRFRKVHDYIALNNFSGDEENNLVILVYDSPTEVNQSNYLSHFIYGIDSCHVDSVISSGRLILQDRKILTVNEFDILELSRELGQKLWEKMRA
jgi:cytosine/adenosine deaminase-related metal-dependent hydrolase